MGLDRRTLRRFGAAVVGASLVACGAALGAGWWIERSARPYIHNDVGSVPARQVAIVLGARVYADGTPSVTLADRLRAALELYRAGRCERILVSGDHAAPEYDEVNAMWRWLRKRGVPEAHVFLDHAGVRTLDTMQRAARVFEVQGAVICTQEFHLARSVFLARRAGIDAVGLVADRRTYAHDRRNRLREVLARSVAFVDSYLTRTDPRHLGEKIPIDGDARRTHDRSTR